MKWVGRCRSCGALKYRKEGGKVVCNHRGACSRGDVC